jgi:hypothetical protein
MKKILLILLLLTILTLLHTKTRDIEYINYEDRCNNYIYVDGYKIKTNIITRSSKSQYTSIFGKIVHITLTDDDYWDAMENTCVGVIR